MDETNVLVSLRQEDWFLGYWRERDALVHGGYGIDNRMQEEAPLRWYELGQSATWLSQVE